jgi:hypothetical protein
MMKSPSDEYRLCSHPTLGRPIKSQAPKVKNFQSQVPEICAQLPHHFGVSQILKGQHKSRKVTITGKADSLSVDNFVLRLYRR